MVEPEDEVGVMLAKESIAKRRFVEDLVFVGKRVE